MRLYLIAIVVALIGLWISSAVQAGQCCAPQPVDRFDAVVH